MSEWWVTPMRDIGDSESLGAADIEALVRDCCLRAGFAAHVAGALAQTTLAAEKAGQRRLGLGLLPQIIEHARAGRVDPQADPTLEAVAPAGLRADAGGGFTCPAVTAATPELAALAARQGLACLVVENAYPVASVASLRADLASRDLVLVAIVEGLVPRAGPGGRVALTVEPVTHGLPRGAGGPLPWPHIAAPGIPQDFEGPVGTGFRLTHRFLAIRRALWPAGGDADAPKPPVKDSSIAVPVRLLEKIINA